MNLTDIGWTAEREAAFAPLRDQGFFPGRVTVSYGSSCIAWTDAGEIKPTVAGRLKLGRDDEPAVGHPVVGDWVALRPADGTGAPLVNQVLPRATAFVRKVAGLQTRPQVVAANIDCVFIVTSTNRDFNARRLERYLTLTRESGARPVVILNKTDLAGPELPQYVEEAHHVAGDVPVHAVCALTGNGVDDLTPYLQNGQTVAMLGSSGVGKSTLINRLMGNELIRTQEVRDDDRGRHTTTTRELLVLPNGALVIDTPGMRELQLWEGSEGLQEAFDDILQLAAACRFRDCSHNSEPGCAVRAAVDSGTLDTDRYESYLRLQDEVRTAETRKTELGRSDRKRHERAGSKAMKQFKKR